MEIETCEFEKNFFSNIRPVLDFLDLSNIADLLSLSKRIILTLSEAPYTIVYILKRFYLSQEHLSPETRKFFKIILTKRVKVDFNKMRGI